jgi:hypothetical protein
MLTPQAIFERLRGQPIRAQNGNERITPRGSWGPPGLLREVVLPRGLSRKHLDVLAASDYAS